MYNLFAIVMFELHHCNNCIMYYISIVSRYSSVVVPKKLDKVRYFISIIDFPGVRVIMII